MNKLNEQQLIEKAQEDGYERTLRLCHTKNCCPTLSVSEDVDADKAVKLTDDFGNQIYMSKEQLQAIIEFAKEDKIIV